MRATPENEPRDKDDKLYLVPPVRLALVHLNKPIDLSAVAQIAIATGHVEVDLVGSTLPLDHQKVTSKLSSWNVEPGSIGDIITNRYDTVRDLKANNPGSRLVGTVVKGGENPFAFDWLTDDIVVIGGANGLSNDDKEQMDVNVSIPTQPETSFLTVAVVASALAYHILTKRNLWEKFQQTPQ